jgi:hypothetical protein
MAASAFAVPVPQAAKLPP